jgi:hypothetical protein
MRISRGICAVVLVAAVAGMLLVSARACAQAPAFGDSTGAVEVGLIQEWFHRELEPAVYDNTQWNISSILLSYSVTSRFTFSFQTGMSTFDHEDFPNSHFVRYAVGGGVAATVFRHNAWDVGIAARYLDTFDLDDSETSLHKRVQSFYASATLGRHFGIRSQPVFVYGGPVYADDRLQTYAWDSRDPVESDSGAAFGAQVGARIVAVKFISVFGYANYLEQAQGGVGLMLHAGGGGL